MALRDPLSAGSLPDLVRLLNGKFRDLAQQFAWLIDGKRMPDVVVTAAGVRVEPGFKPRDWHVFKPRASTAVAMVVATAVDDKGLTLATFGGDVTVDVWMVP